MERNVPTNIQLTGRPRAQNNVSCWSFVHGNNERLQCSIRLALVNNLKVGNVALGQIMDQTFK